MYVYESCQTDGPIGTKFCTRVWIHLGMDIMLKKQFATRYPTAAFWGVLGGQQFKSLGNVVERLDRSGINFAHIMQVNLGMDTG